MKAKLFTLGLSACLLCNLCACGSSGISSNPDPAGAVESTGSGEASTPTTAENAKTYSTRTETCYGANGEVYYWIESTYGSNGDLESVTSYRADGSESGHVDITYDEHGNMLTGYGSVGVGQSTSSGEALPSPGINETTGSVYPVQYEYEYDADGNLTKKASISTQGTQHIDEYDDDGNIIRSTYKSGSTQSISEYEYNDTCKRINCNSYNQDQFVSRTAYEYDSGGTLTAAKIYTPTGDLYDATLYQYDTEGREVIRENYVYFFPDSEGELMYRTECEYTADGKIAKRSEYSYGLQESLEYTLYYYDEQGATSAYERYFASAGQETLFERIEYTYT